MNVRPLKTEADYDAALQAIAPYFEHEPTPGSPAGDRFELATAAWPAGWPSAASARRAPLGLAATAPGPG